MLMDLVEMHDNNVLKIKRIQGTMNVAGGVGYTDDIYIPDRAIMGGMELSMEQCNLIAQKLGWIEHDLDSIEVINKTDKLIGGIKKYVKENQLLMNTRIEFQNRRKLNTTSYFDRIKMVCDGYFDITILYNIQGAGRKYTIYTSTNNFKQPIAKISSLSKLGEWLCELVG